MARVALSTPCRSGQAKPRGGPSPPASPPCRFVVRRFRSAGQVPWRAGPPLSGLLLAPSRARRQGKLAKALVLQCLRQFSLTSPILRCPVDRRSTRRWLTRQECLAKISRAFQPDPRRVGQGHRMTALVPPNSRNPSGNRLPTIRPAAFRHPRGTDANVHPRSRRRHRERRITRGAARRPRTPTTSASHSASRGRHSALPSPLQHSLTNRPTRAARGKPISSVSGVW